MSPIHKGSGVLRTPLPALCAEDVPGADKEEVSTDDEENALGTSSDENGEDSGETTGTTTGSDDENGRCCAIPDAEDKVQMPQKGIFEDSQRLARFGYLAQYFAVGIIYAGVPATTYGVFLGYLNVPAYVYATVSVISSLPWSFKFLIGLISDICPIRGFRRKPYMMMGWTLCALALIWLGFTPLPEPYWCIDDVTGEYIQKQTMPDGTVEPADPCNEDASKEGGKYAFLLMLACLGYVIADVAADGLTTEYAKREPLAQRGTTQTTAYLTRTIGAATSTMFVGLCMNSKRYKGSFDWGFSFEQVALIYCIPALAMVPISALCVVEPRDPNKPQPKLNEYMSMCWELLKSKACFYIIWYAFLSSAIGGIMTPAGGNVKYYWAGVENFQNQLFSLVGHSLFAVGLWLVRKYFLGVSWRLLLTVTLVMLQAIDFVFSTITIFDVFRNQYFYLGETVLTEFPMAANFVVGTFVIVEMADDGNEGMVYGLLTTTMNLGSPVSRAIGNQLYELFRPSLSDAKNYIRDTPEFRRVVFGSFLLSYFFAIFSLSAVWYFLPDQKEQTQERKKTWKKRPIYGYSTLILLSIAFTYSLLVNFLAMFPSTMCLKFAGGDGCDGD